MDRLQLPISESELSQLAQRTARGEQHLAEELTQHVLIQFWCGRYHSDRGSFPAWACRLLRNYRADTFRRPHRSVGGEQAIQERIDAKVTSDLLTTERNLDLTTPFDREDLNAVRSWSPRQRFVILGWSGLWGKLPESDQHRTLAAVKPVVRFPVPNFLDWPDHERTEYLADALRVPPNTVTQIRCRGRAGLHSLRFVKELRE